jgi:outer membrane autotransporter protein
MSCPTQGGVGAIVVEGQCLWAKVGGRTFDQGRTRTNLGGDVDAWNLSAGAQVALEGNLRLGFAGSYERTNIDTRNDASSDGDRVEGGVVLKDRWGATSLAGAVFGGYGWFDTDRPSGLPGVATAKGDHEISFGGVQARLSHLIDGGDGWYAKPLIDLNATYIDYGGLRETGGAGRLQISGNEDWVLSASPALEIGRDWTSDDLTFRPFVRLGVSFMNDNDFSLTSSFIGAPAGIAPFTITSEFDNVALDLSAGVDVLSLGGMDIKLNYDGRFSDDSQMHAGGLKVSVPF